ncbi:MAG: L-threonylcarbamoyladenylate synthase, partial [Pirellulaceae bacterium]
ASGVMLVKTEVLLATDDAIRRAANLLRLGRLVAFPTETVYGLGADADNPQAVQALFAAKGRPADHPVIVHLAEASQIDDWATDIPLAAHRLADAFWPGPLTMILHRGRRASDLVTGGLGTVGLRVPAHSVARQLLQSFGGAIAAPSANRFGRVSPTSAAHVYDELAGRIDLVLDGGECQVGLESTIVDLSSDCPAVLRPGGISVESLAAVLAGALRGATAGAPRVSGSLESHYAPRARVELVAQCELAAQAERLSRQGRKVAVLARPGQICPETAGLTIIPVPADDEGLARVLYAALRQVDALGCDWVLVALPNEQGIGAAIADRLRKAAGPRAG